MKSGVSEVFIVSYRLRHELGCLNSTNCTLSTKMEQIERDIGCKENTSASEDKNGSDSLLENVIKSSDSGCEENTEVQHDVGCKEVQDDCVDGDLDPRIQVS